MYTIGQLAKMAGVTTRTLRYYDQIGLLKPMRTSEAGYRLYDSAEVDTLQQILFYRALGVGPDEIKSIMNAPLFDRQNALEEHLAALLARRGQMDALIETVRKTLTASKEGFDMTDEEKFTGLKQKLIDDNERQYGAEARALYGKAVDQSNEKIMGMTPAQFARMEALTSEVNEALKAAMLTNDPTGASARHLCELHRQWLMCTWTSYSVEAHKGLAQMYADDERFAAYYNAIAPGAAVFLRDALMHCLAE